MLKSIFKNSKSGYLYGVMIFGFFVLQVSYAEDPVEGDIFMHAAIVDEEKYFQNLLEPSEIEKIKLLQAKLFNNEDLLTKSNIDEVWAEYRNICESYSLGIVMTTMNGDIIDANKAYQFMLGYNLDELKGLTYQDLTPQKWHAIEEEIVSGAKSESYVNFQKEYIKKDGSVFPVDITGWIIKDVSGNYVGTGSIVRDMSQLSKEQGD